jgi:hypothetical protein
MSELDERQQHGDDLRCPPRPPGSSYGLLVACRALIRPSGKRRQERLAGSRRAANAASRWGGPDFTTGVRARRKIGTG